MIHQKTCSYQKFHREAAFGLLGWTKPWATWAEFSVLPALSRRLDQKSPDVPSIWAALSFCEKLPWAGFCHFKTNGQVSRFLLAGAQLFKTNHHFWQKGWEPIFTRWPSGYSYTPPTALSLLLNPEFLVHIAGKPGAAQLRVFIPCPGLSLQPFPWLHGQ